MCKVNGYFYADYKIFETDAPLQAPTLEKIEVKGLDGVYALLNMNQTYQVITTQPVVAAALDAAPAGKYILGKTKIQLIRGKAAI